MPVDVSLFREHGRGLITYLRRTDVLHGWYYVPADRVVFNNENEILLRKDWWKDGGTKIDRTKTIFVWKTKRPLRDCYGPVDLLVETAKVDHPTITVFPNIKLLFHEELLLERMIVGNLHVVYDRLIELDDPDALYLPVPLTVWENIQLAWFDNETDGIIAVTAMDSTTTPRELLDVINKHVSLSRYGRAWTSKDSQKEMWQSLRQGFKPGQLNVMGASVGTGKSMLMHHYLKYMSDELDIVYLDTEAPLKIRTPAVMKPSVPKRERHRITSVQQRDKSVRRSRRK